MAPIEASRKFGVSDTLATSPALTRMGSTFPGKGEMARLSREFDWSTTALGPVETWSQALRTSVSTMLSSRNPMFIWWGPKFIQLYNDSYRPSLGESGRHPAALGAQGPAFWTDIWERIAPEIQDAMNGVSSWHEDALIPIERNGVLENVWWTYGYSPIRDDDGSIGGVLVVCMETTQRRLDEQERDRLLATLISERSRLSSIFDLSPSFLAIARGPDHILERVNAAYVTLVGDRELIGKSVADAFPESRGQGLIRILDQVRATGEPFIAMHFPIDLARGEGGALETRYVDLIYQRIVDPDGEPIIIAHGVDVTDQVLSAQSLERIELQLRDQFAKLPVPTILWEKSERDFILIDFNEAAGRAIPALTGSLGKGFLDLLPDRPHIPLLFSKCLQNNVVCENTEIVSTEGGMRTFEFTIGPQQPNRVLVHAIDITRRAELEEQLRQAQKMEAVGQLAGGIAHDFNNVLTVIEGHSSLLMEALGEDDDRYGDAEEINKAGIRAAGLTRQLLAFSNKQIVKVRPLALNILVEQTSKLLTRLFGDHIGIALELHASPDAVVGDPSEYSQVLMNLALNARDAMDGHGTITISTSTVPILPAPVSVNTVLPKEYVLLQITDSGKGISEEIRERIFEPFFTTKPEGMGTGLGLATVYTIVTRASGYVVVESEPARGTTFSIYLPAASEPAATSVEIATKTESPGGKTVLLVEDESAVRKVVRRMLEIQGYRVITAEDGPTALRVAETYEGDIDLVVSDTVMPGMGGAEVVAQLKELRPALKALFMSGHTDDQLLRSGISAAQVKFIQKPFTAGDFATAVTDALTQ